MQTFNQPAGRQKEQKSFLMLFCLVLLALFTQGKALAQTPASRFEATGLDKPAQDIALTGTVDQLSFTRTPGAPRGFLLTVNGPQGALTASLGLNLSPQLQQALATGAVVQLAGILETIGGTRYLMARTITTRGEQTVLRNQHGFAVHSQARASAFKTNLSRGTK